MELPRDALSCGLGSLIDGAKGSSRGMALALLDFEAVNERTTAQLNSQTRLPYTAICM
jgi:hypothetical protein